MKSLAEVASVVCNVGLAVSTKYTLQTDRQTDRHADRHTVVVACMVGGLA